ncbi:MAG: glucosylglycerate phosphorylase [Calditrichia bacterium]
MKKSNVQPSRFHLLEPDYRRPVYQVPEDVRNQMLDHLIFLYGLEEANECLPELERIMQVYYAHKAPEMIEWEKQLKTQARFSENDVVLITYGDLVKAEDQLPLDTLAELSKKYLKGIFNIIHILPFFPSSSDRGFAIKNFEEVDPQLGDWEDICHLKDDFKLMFDGVFNHVSSKSRWFQEFLNQNPEYLDFFTVFSTREEIKEDYLQLLIRPRDSEVLTEFDTLRGKRLVWTTFSPDQIDLNYHNPKVLLRMVEILLYYIRRGADLIRLDAVTYLWDQPGTSGVHLQQTHVILRLFRLILDTVAPHVILLTETNVPHSENIAYFGNGNDEAHMIYNFTLAPLVLHAFQTGGAQTLTRWAQSLKKISDTATYLNILDSHDGISVYAAKGISSEIEIEQMASRVQEHEGFVYYKKDGDGSQTPYEFNITWYSAINRDDAKEDVDLQIKRYLASRVIALILMGVPGIYLHGLLGSRNDVAAVIEEEQSRSINRKCISKKELIRALNNPQTTTYKIARKMADLISLRTKEKAFHPNALQRILEISPHLFCVWRYTPDKREHILAIANVTDRLQTVQINLKSLSLNSLQWTDIISQKNFSSKNGMLNFSLEPYDFYWLKPVS